MDHRKNWTQKQAELRKALSSKAHFDEASALFMEQHAAVHCADISGGLSWSLQDEVMTGLTEVQIKKVPRPGQNSIVWLLWHITRIEDMTINTLALDQSQVWTADWAARLCFPLPDCGASMDDNDVHEFSQMISVRTILEYRAAVGRRTRETVRQLSAEQTKEIVPTEIVQKLVDEGSINSRANWLYEYYLNRNRGFFLTRTATSHNFIHLNEAGRIGKKLTAS